MKNFLIFYIAFISLNNGISQCWKDIYCGHDFTLAIRDDNKCWAWGDNHINVFETGEFFKSKEPKYLGEFVRWIPNSQNKIAIIRNEGIEFYIYDTWHLGIDNDVESKDWRYISRTSTFTLGIKENGTLWSWGDNSYGALGNGSTIDSSYPKMIGKDKDWSMISSGDFHSVALKKDGSLWSWGSNGYGQLGYKSELFQLTPKKIESKNSLGWISVDASGSYTFAISKDSSLWAWGYNEKGELGLGNKLSSNNTIRQIGSEKNWKKISAGSSHFAAVKNDGTLWIWGYNSKGQLGIDSLSESMTPIEVSCPK